MRTVASVVAAMSLVAVLWGLLCLHLGTTAGGGVLWANAVAAPGLQDATVLTRVVPQPVGAGVRASALERPASGAGGDLEVAVVVQGRPLPGAAVHLYRRNGWNPGTGTPEWWQAGGGVTDAEGRVHLAARPGSYLVSAHAGNLAPALCEVVRPQGEPLTRVELVLSPGVTLQLRTTVRRTGEPVPLAEVRLIREPTPARRGPPQIPAEEQVVGATDRRGQLRLDGLAPGRYRVEARAVGYARWVREILSLPRPDDVVIGLQEAGVMEGFVLDGAGRPASGATVAALGSEQALMATTGEGGGFALEVEVGGRYQLTAHRGTEASLPRTAVVAPGTVVRGISLKLESGGAIEGTVVAAPTGAAVSGALVSIRPCQRMGEVGRAFSGANGAFTVEGLSPGCYDVAASAPGHPELVRSGIAVISSQRRSLRLELRGTGAVEGVVFDGHGHPVPGALVRVSTRWGDPLPAGAAPARADAEGRYRLGELPPGRAWLLAQGAEEVARSIREVEIREVETAHVDFSLQEGGVLEGWVTRERGRRSDLKLVVVASQPYRHADSGWILGTAPVEADGHYRLELSPGSYRVQALPEAGSTRLQPSSAMEDVMQDARVEAGKTTRLDLTLGEEDEESTGARRAKSELEPNGSLRGRVLSEEGPVDGFSLRVFSPTAGEELRFAGDCYELVDLPGGRVSLSVTTADGRRGTAQYMLEAGEDTVLDIPLTKAASISGRLMDASTRKPVTGKVRVGDTAGGEQTVQVAADGSFRLTGLLPGKRRLMILVPGSVTAREVTVAAGQELDLGEIPIEVSPKQNGTIGAQLMMAGRQVVLGWLVPDGPAEQAGLRVGDELVEVDGMAVNDLSDALRHLRGEPGTSLMLTLRRAGEVLEMQVIRAE